MKDSNKLDINSSLDFIFGGNSTFTALNTKSENRFTFKVKKHKKDDIYFVSVLTGPETYQFIGSYKGVFKHSAKSLISDKSQSVNVFRYIIDNSILLIVLVSFYTFYSIFSEKKLKTKRLESYSHNLRLKRQGDRCYGCGFDISEDSYKFDTENFKLCDSCRRDESLRLVLSKWPSTKKFNKFILSKRFDRFLIGIIVFDVLLIVFSIVSLLFKYPSFMSYSNYILCIYWFLMIYRLFIVYKNKQKVL